MRVARTFLAAMMFLTVALAGCSGGGMSSKEMAAKMNEALTALPDDVGSGGVFSGARVQAQLPRLSDWIEGTADQTFNPDFAISFGLDDDLLGAMSFFGVSVEFYCTPEALGIVTEGMKNFGAEDLSFEQRNLAGACLDLALEEATDAYGDEAGQIVGYFVDPTALLAAPTKLEQVGKDIHASYDVPDATVKVIAGGGHVKQLIIEVEEPEGRFVIQFIQGDRSALTMPEPKERLASVVKGISGDGDFGYRWLGESGDIQSAADYEVRVYDVDANVRCGGMPSDLVATFDLGAGNRQTVNGYTLTFVESGNGKLGASDRIDIQHPNLSQDWSDEAVIWDQWAGRSAHRLCQ